MIDTKQLNDDILKFWRETPESIRGEHWPVLFPPFKGGTILFMGLNPSGEKDKSGKYKLNNSKDLENQEIINKMLEYEKNSKKENKRYFGPFLEITFKLGLEDFDHLDLYFYRGTKSAEFKKMMEDSKCKEFAEKQLAISLDFLKLKLINQKIIFVANAKSSQIIKDNFKIEIDDTKFNENGFDFISLGNSKIPIFFSGMISSARRIDDYSLERLIWHLKKAINFGEGEK